MNHSAPPDPMSSADSSPNAARYPLAGRLAVLTGATGALGHHLAMSLVEDGASLVACHHRDLSQEAARALDEVRARAVGARQRVIVVQADLCQAKGRSRVFDAAARLGGCDLLVNSASILSRQRFEETSAEEMASLMALNVTAPMACSRVAVEQMRGKGGGDIVHVLDVGGGLIPWKKGAAYCASRAAIAMLTRCLALELMPDIRVNALAPGLIDLPDAVPPGALDRVPMGRPAKVAEVIAAFRFLVSGPRSMSGEILAVDGGRGAIG